MNSKPERTPDGRRIIYADRPVWRFQAWLWPSWMPEIVRDTLLAAVIAVVLLTAAGIIILAVIR